MTIKELSIKALKKYVVVTLQIAYWTGEKKIDLKYVLKSDDPGPLVKGLLKVDSVETIAAIDRRARYTLDSFSTRFGPLKLVPEKSLDTLISLLNGIKKSFDDVARETIARYPNKLKVAKEKYPHLAQAIDMYFKPDISDRFYFSWNLLRILPETKDDEDALSQTLIDANIQNLADVKKWLNKLLENGKADTRTLKALYNALQRAQDNVIIEDTEVFTLSRSVLQEGELDKIDPVRVSLAIAEANLRIEQLSNVVVSQEDLNLNTNQGAIIVERGEE